MAQVFGAPARNAQEAVRQRAKRIVAWAFSTIGIVGFLSGYAAGGVFPIRGLPLLWIFLIITLLCGLTWLIGKRACDQIDSIDRDRLAWRKGAAGEALVGAALAELPDNFIVVNDVSKRLGNIDHVVVGPTGTYVIDAKNWIGSVEADANGELKLNGKAVSKPAIKSLLAAVMSFQSKLKALTEADYFVRGVMVFPSAYVRAAFGSTRQVHCLCNDRLIEYLQGQKPSRKLASSEVERIKLATLQLAGMDERFVA